jgi:hypothetical protein
MRGTTRIAIVSDIHYACDAERARGDDYELRLVSSAFTRWLLGIYRRYIWLREPLRMNYLLDRFLELPKADFIVGNGDYSCDSGFIGVADNASFASVAECFSKIRSSFGVDACFTCGDHDLGKKDFFGTHGGMRLESVRRIGEELGAALFWTREFPPFVLAGVTSSLLALESLNTELLPEERAGWQKLREEHVAQIRKLFSALRREQRVVLFCHDPTGLPFLLGIDEVQAKLDQVALTIIGHLHSPFIFNVGKRLAGMPEINFLGHTPRKLSRALRRAGTWKRLKVELCPSLAGMELFKDGGYGLLELNHMDASVAFRVQRISR